MVQCYPGTFDHTNGVCDEAGDRFALFEFRWRTDTTYAEAARNLADAIKLVREKTGNNKKVVIIAHSFGGLLARAYLQDLDGASAQSNVANEVSTLVTIGTPHSGIFSSSSLHDGIQFPSGTDNALINLTAYPLSSA